MASIDPGTVAEYLFAARCLQYGYLVSWPSSKHVSYDVLVDNDVSILRVQIKATFVKSAGSNTYQVNTRKNSGKTTYTKDECDLFACYVDQTKSWYIFPSEVIAGKPAVNLYPHRADEDIGMYEHYREAWHLLKEAKK